MLQRLKSRKLISELFEKGSFVSGNELFARYLFNCNDELEAAFEVSVAISVPKKKIPLAVNRNRVKRLIRESCRCVLKDPVYESFSGTLLIIIVLKSVDIPSYAVVKASIESIFSKIGRKHKSKA